MTACSSSRQAVNSSSETRATELRNTEARDSVVIELRDTLREVTTITYVLRQAQEPNEPEDTVFRSVVTDRTAARSRDAIAVQKTKTEVRVDTVFIEKRDSIEIRSRPSVGGGQSGGTALHKTLRLVLWIIVAVIALIIVVRLRK